MASQAGAPFNAVWHVWGVSPRWQACCRSAVPAATAAASMAPERGACGRPLPREAPSCGPEAGLPQAFLQSLRTLFDILDDGRRGFVHLREIESRWLQQQQGAEAQELPRGVLEGLRQAAPASGYLTFERFVLGLRASLFCPERGNGPPAAPAPAAKTAQGQERPLPQAAGGEAPNALAGRGRGAARGGAARSLEKFPDAQAEAEQMQQQQQGKKRADVTQKSEGLSQNESASKITVEGRHHQQRGRGEHRRHTITSGVDYGMLKQMKELEKEKDFLLQGLEMVERARQWYHQQIHVLLERQKQLGKSKVHHDFPTEGSLSQLNRLLPKLQEVNRCLCDLLGLSAKSAVVNGLACSAASSPPIPGPQQTIYMLKEQNRLLTKEVTDKSERITQLEQEKSALIKQLFEARSQSNQETNPLDSTFI